MSGNIKEGMDGVTSLVFFYMKFFVTHEDIYLFNLCLHMFSAIENRIDYCQ